MPVGVDVHHVLSHDAYDWDRSPYLSEDWQVIQVPVGCKSYPLHGSPETHVKRIQVNMIF